MDSNTDHSPKNPAPNFLLPPTLPRCRRSLSLTSSIASRTEASSSLEAPEPPPIEVIASLISSLSAITSPPERRFSTSTSLGNVQEHSFGYGSLSDIEPPVPLSLNTAFATYRPSRTRSSASQQWLDNQHRSYYQIHAESPYEQPLSDEDDDDDDDAAIPPVIRFSKSSPEASDQRLWWSRHRTPSKLQLKKSNQSLLSQFHTARMNMSSQQASPTSSSSRTYTTRGSHSRRAWDTISKHHPEEYECEREIPIRTPTRRPCPGMLGEMTHASRVKTSDSKSRENSDHYSNVALHSAGERAGSQKTYSPSTRSGHHPDFAGPAWTLAGHQVPSRGSSLRHSLSESPQEGSLRSSETEYSPVGSKYSKSDPSPLEDEDQTVRRIRELQEAKEMRDQEIHRAAPGPEGSMSHIPMPNTVLPQHIKSQQISGIPEHEPLLDVNNDLFDGRDHTISMPAVSHTRSLTSNSEGLTAEAKYSFPSPFATPARTSSRRVVSGSSSSQTHGGGPKLINAERRPRPSPTARPSTAQSFSGSSRPRTADSIDQAVNAFVNSPRLTRKIRHPQTGRVIAFSEVGDPDGFAVICCIGMGLTRYLTAFYDELAKTSKLRLITPDRPGVGESELCLDGTGTPLNWPDDVSLICSHLGITKFSLLAHSAGAIYAFATALRMPQHVRGRLHLLAPWIPPSQMSIIGNSNKESRPAANLPYLQKLLRVLPTSFLKAANATFLSDKSVRIADASKRGRSSSRRRGVETDHLESPSVSKDDIARNRSSSLPPRMVSLSLHGPANTMNAEDVHTPRPSSRGQFGASPDVVRRVRSTITLGPPTSTIQGPGYDERLTHSIWSLATKDANPTVDLLICLERRQAIGFRYVDISRAVVIHHGSRDTRVPVDNVKWLGQLMPRCEVRVLEGEGHGLMANAQVMVGVLNEIAKEWDDWQVVTKGTKMKREGRRESGTA